MLFPEIRTVISMPRLASRGKARLSRFGPDVIRQVACRGTGPTMRRAPIIHYRACSVCDGGVAPRMEFASLHGTSQRYDGQYRCPIRAIVPRWYRRTESRPLVPYRLAA